MSDKIYKDLNGVKVEMVGEEKDNHLAVCEKIRVQNEQEVADREAKDALKASAKAKLIAGEALTEAEADTIVL